MVDEAAKQQFQGWDMSMREKITFMLEREGWAMDAVRASTDAEVPLPSYAYTVGFEDRFGFPEVCIFGLSPVACRGLFGLIVEFLAGGTELPIDAPFLGILDGGQPSAFLTVDAAASVGLFPALAEHHTVAGEPPDAFRMVQFAWPDPAGHLPWEPGFADELAPVQLLLGDPPG